MKKKIMMIMPVMKGGGAERVAAQLINEFHRKGHDVKFLLTSSMKEEVNRTDLNPEIPLVLLQEEIMQRKIKGSSKISRILASLFCKVYEKVGLAVPARLAYWSFMNQYGIEVEYIRNLMKADPDMTVISFLQPSIPMTVLAGRGLPNKIVISERGNPERLMKHRYGKGFIEKYYQGISSAVFQTEQARKTYPENIGKKGIVISNPIKEGLPEAYFGERRKVITTFCRISKQKNLPLLVKAFYLLQQDFSEYKLRIIGDSLNEEGELVYSQLNDLVDRLKIKDKVVFEPFMDDVHSEILRDAMYVNSSDYEGISNAMLEAMAIGMPVVCTDCPIGGARATIKNDENGLLVPTNDENELYKAMKEIVENSEFAKQLSIKGLEIQNRLSLENISELWMEIL